MSIWYVFSAAWPKQTVTRYSCDGNTTAKRLLVSVCRNTYMRACICFSHMFVVSVLQSAAARMERDKQFWIGYSVGIARAHHYQYKNRADTKQSENRPRFNKRKHLFCAPRIYVCASLVANFPHFCQYARHCHAGLLSWACIVLWPKRRWQFQHDIRMGWKERREQIIWK